MSQWQFIATLLVTAFVSIRAFRFIKDTFGDRSGNSGRFGKHWLEDD